MYRIIIRLVIVFVRIIKMAFKSKEDIILENLALRRQVSTYLEKKLKPQINDFDRSFWVALKETWSKWVDTLVIVKPDIPKDRHVFPWIEVNARFGRIEKIG